VTDNCYRTPVADFLASLAPSHQALRCQVEQDTALCNYIHLLYFRGEAPAAARVLLHGLVYVRRLTLRDPYELKDSRAALKGFERDVPEQQENPVLWATIVLIAGWAIFHLGREGLDAARALFVAYDGYCRPADLLSILVFNILVRRATAMSRMASLSATVAPSGAFRLQALRLTPHTCRLGGASSDFAGRHRS
jgi:hypothetical protein